MVLSSPGRGDWPCRHKSFCQPVGHKDRLEQFLLAGIAFYVVGQIVRAVECHVVVLETECTRVIPS